MFPSVTHAFRVLRKGPVFTAVAIGSMAIGIGATAAMFNFADAMLVRPIVSGQVALSLVLLAVSAALVQGFRGELTEGPGFRTDRLFLNSFDTQLIHYSADQTRTFYDDLLRKAHLGEVSVTVWPRILKDMCERKNIHVLE